MALTALTVVVVRDDGEHLDGCRRVDRVNGPDGRLLVRAPVDGGGCLDGRGRRDGTAVGTAVVDPAPTVPAAAVPTAKTVGAVVHLDPAASQVDSG